MLVYAYDGDASVRNRLLWFPDSAQLRACESWARISIIYRNPSDNGDLIIEQDQWAGDHHTLWYIYLYMFVYFIQRRKTKR